MSVTHWFFKCPTPRADTTPPRRDPARGGLELRPCCVFCPAFCPIRGAPRCTSPPRRGWTSALGPLGGTSTFVALICKSVRSFPMRALPEYRFWKGSHLKTSNEMASEVGTEAFSFGVLQRSPCQNSGFGGFGGFETCPKPKTATGVAGFAGFETCPKPKTGGEAGPGGGPQFQVL